MTARLVETAPGEIVRGDRVYVVSRDLLEVQDEITGRMLEGLEGGSDGFIIEDPSEDGPFTVVDTDPSGAGIVALYDKTIHYAGMEPIVDTSLVDTVVVHGSVYDDVVILEDASGAGEMQIRSLSGDFFDAETAYSISALVFENPADTLIFRLGAGEDSLILSSFDQDFSAAILFEGGGGFDTLTGPDDINTWMITA